MLKLLINEEASQLELLKWSVKLFLNVLIVTNIVALYQLFSIHRMTMEDFQANFTRIEICMLTPDSVLEENEKKSWKIRREKGRWQADATAGGCRNFIDTFHINPQIRY